MSNTPWKTDKWYTSHWNFAPEATKDFCPAEKIKFHDVTLRDGEQQAGLVFNKEQKIALADKMAEMGMHRIEAGMPAVSPQDAEAIKAIAKKYDRPGDPEIFGFARCMRADVMKSVDCGVKGIIVEVPSSDHLLKYGYKWELQRAIDLAIDATKCAKENGLYTVFFCIDGSRTGLEDFTKIITSVANEGHMDALALVDTMGGLAPHAAPYLVKSIKSVIDKPLEVHFHDDFGMGAAATVMALMAGAEVAHTSITGIGERAGNTPYEDVALSLLTMYGIDTGLKYDKMYELSEMMRKFSGHSIPTNRGIVGPTLAQIESGIVADWYNNAKDIAPLEVSPYLYSLVGHPDVEIVMGKNCGAPNVNMWLDKIGLKSSGKEQTLEIIMAVKAKSFEKGGLLTLGEFADIAHKIIG